MGKFQRVQHIAAHEDVGIDAVALELASQPDMVCASRFERLGGLGSIVLIARIRATDAGDPRAGSPEGGNGFGDRLRRDRWLGGLKAARGKQVAGEIRAGIVLGNRAERREENGRPLGRRICGSASAVASLSSPGRSTFTKWAKPSVETPSFGVTGGMSATGAVISSSSGNSLTPVIGTLRLAMSLARASRTSAIRFWNAPETSASA